MSAHGLDPWPASALLTRESWLTCTSFPDSRGRCENDRATRELAYVNRADRYSTVSVRAMWTVSKGIQKGDLVLLA